MQVQGKGVGERGRGRLPISPELSSSNSINCSAIKIEVAFKKITS